MKALELLDKSEVVMKLKTCIPMNDEYVALLGQALYSFTYYEWTIISIIDCFKKGFIQQHYREKIPFTKRDIEDGFVNINIANDPKLQNCKHNFDELQEERNALVHSHPCTSKNGEQVLNYQASTDKKFHDFLWDAGKLKDFINKVDKAVSETSQLFDSYRKISEEPQH